MMNTVTPGRLLALTVLALVIWAPLAAEGPSCRTWNYEWFGTVVTFAMLFTAAYVLCDWLADLFFSRRESP